MNKNKSHSDVSDAFWWSAHATFSDMTYTLSCMFLMLFCHTFSTEKFPVYERRKRGRINWQNLLPVIKNASWNCILELNSSEWISRHMYSNILKSLSYNLSNFARKIKPRHASDFFKFRYWKDNNVLLLLLLLLTRMMIIMMMMMMMIISYEEKKS